MKYKINDLNDLEEFAKIFLQKISIIKSEKALVVCLNGDLGSGKTTFTQLVANLLNIKEKVISPTFIISKIYNIHKNEYLIQKKLVHIDAYRLKNEEGLKNIGFYEQVENRDNIIFIEWSDIVKKGLLKNCISINFKYLDLEKNLREVELVD